MDTLPYNSGAINSSASLATIVYLPSAHATMGMVLAERNSVTLSGGMSFGIDLLGDISKVSNLGQASVDIGIEVDGSLTKNQIVVFGAENISFGLDGTGQMTALRTIPPASVSTSWDATGSMVRRVPMSGAFENTWTFDGALTLRRSLGTAAVSSDLSLSGVLGAIQYLSGSTLQTIDPTGSLSLFRRNFIGYSSVTTSFETTGYLQLTGGLNGHVSSAIDAAGSLNVNRGVEIPYAISVKELSASGTLRLTGGLSGSSTKSMTGSGKLSRGARVTIPQSTVSTSFDCAGALSQTFAMVGSVSFGIESTGSMYVLPTLSGNTSSGFSLGGELFNNAETQDLSAFLMKRRATNREMTR